ncbi:MAG: MaoC/PaaZ C-terminal domain-containing protein [Pseudomonadota bacterium]
MPIDYERLKARAFAPIVQTYATRDTILYALGIGLGRDPLDSDQLRFTFEEAEGFAALPTMPVVLGTPGFWAREPDTGITWQKVLHGEQGFTLHAPLPPAATITATNRIVDIIDKGADKGALIYIEREITDESTGQRLATNTSTIFARGDGGFGGPSGPVKPVHTLPDRAPDAAMDWRVAPEAALIYRLSGDPNPLHAAPEVAAAAGFKAPILHGLCTLGIAGWAVLKTVGGADASRLKSLDLRFSAPVTPGETVRTEMWRDGHVVSFRARVDDRVVLNNGKAVITEG